MKNRDETPPEQPDSVKNLKRWLGLWRTLFQPPVLVVYCFVALATFNVTGFWYQGEIKGLQGEIKENQGKFEAQEERMALRDDQLKDKVLEADQTIKGMKELALALSAPVLAEMATQSVQIGGSDGPTFQDDVQNFEEIVTVLESLGIPPDKIASLGMPMVSRIKQQLSADVRSALEEANRDRSPLFETAPYMGEWEREQFETFIRENELASPIAVQKAIEKLERFAKHGEFPKG